MVTNKKIRWLRKKLLVLCAGVMSGALLTGCFSSSLSQPNHSTEHHLDHHKDYHEDEHHSDHDHHEDEKSSVGHVHHHHHGEASLPETPWTIGKAEQLRQQMMAYRPPKEGRYQEYFISKSLEWQGVELPQQIVQNSSHAKGLQVTVDGQDQKFLYSQTAEEEGWQIVAIFSNQKDEQAQDKHTYLFVVNTKQEPVVLELQMLQKEIIYVTSDVAPKIQDLFALVMKGD